MTKLVARYKKFAVVVAGVLGQIAALGILAGPAQHYVVVALGVLAALGVKQATNVPA